MRRPIPFFLLTITVIFLNAACSERGITEPVLETSVSFSYSGERSGMFRVHGDVPLTPEGRPRHGTWAAALQLPGSGLNIAAARAATHPFADVFSIALHNITRPGTYQFDPTCDFDTPGSCALGTLIFGYNWDNSGHTPEAVYLLTSGTVSITAMTGTHLTGEFHVAGARQPGGPSIQIAGGTFHVRIVDAQSVRESIEPFWMTPLEFRPWH